MDSMKRECSRGKLFFALVAAWAAILGIMWTYMSMFDVLFAGSPLTESERALIGLFSNLSSALFSNLGTWTLNHTQYSLKQIAFFLNMWGLLTIVALQASAML